MNFNNPVRHVLLKTEVLLPGPVLKCKCVRINDDIIQHNS